MLKRIKLQNSTILIIGIIIILTGIALGFFEFFEERKNRTFSEMNILLYENEIPENKSQNIQSESNMDDDTSDITGSENVESGPNDTHEVESNYMGFLHIPKIKLKRGFFDINSSYNNVDLNVTVINGSTMPDTENNNLILAAHSGSCSYCYFDKLYKLKNGDKAYIDYNGNKYEYEIVKIYDVEKDGTVAIYRDYKKNTLTLITCTRNSNTKQTVYILELVN